MRALKISKSITNRESPSLDRYLQELSTTHPIPVEEEVALIQRIRAGDTLALDKLCKANLRFVVSVAKQYQFTSNLTLADLISQGNIGLVRATRKYDETKGFKFISYAVWWIRQSIIEGLSTTSRMVRLPLNKIGSKSKIEDVVDDFSQLHEREPSPDEIAEMLGVSIEEVMFSLEIGKQHVSIDSPAPGRFYSDGASMIDYYEDVEALKPDQSSVGTKSLQVDISTILKARLKPKEREIITLSFGIGFEEGVSGLTAETLGDMYNLTPERIKQIRSKALKKLQSEQVVKLLKPYLG